MNKTMPAPAKTVPKPYTSKGVCHIDKTKHGYEGFLVRASRNGTQCCKFISAGPLGEVTGRLPADRRTPAAFKEAKNFYNFLVQRIDDPKSWVRRKGRKQLTGAIRLELSDKGFKIHTS